MGLSKLTPLIVATTLIIVMMASDVTCSRGWWGYRSYTKQLSSETGQGKSYRNHYMSRSYEDSRGSRNSVDSVERESSEKRRHVSGKLYVNSKGTHCPHNCIGIKRHWYKSCRRCSGYRTKDTKLPRTLLLAGTPGGLTTKPRP